MWKAQITVGKDYALREKRGGPIQRVRILEHVRGSRWKAEWIDPNPGLIEYVQSGHLIAPWKQLKALLRDEEDAERLHHHNEAVGYQRGSPLERAVEQVFESVGEQLLFYRGCLSADREALDRLKARAGSAMQDSTAAYTDRAATVHLPFDQAVNIARFFCAAEPATVLTNIESTERKWAQEVRRGDDYLTSLLNEYRASWALIRQWTGHDPAVAQREAEIERLERLIWDAVYALQKAGLDTESARLRRAIERR